MDGITFDHVGIAVESLEKALAFYQGVLGLKLEETEVVAGQGVKVAKLHTGKTTIELLEPLGPDSPVAKFIEKRGEGIHHICFEVPDALAVVAKGKEKGFDPVSEGLKPGASGRQVAFLNPKSTFKVMIELSQGPADAGKKK